MARLCIRIAPNQHPTDKSLDALRTQVGDVVEIREDGHQWSKGELSCGQYHFLDVSGVPERDLTYLKDHVEDADGNLIRRRRVGLNLAKLTHLSPRASDIANAIVVK